MPYSTVQLAAEIGLHPATIVRLVRRGEIRADIYPGSGGYRIPDDEAHRLISDFSDSLTTRAASDRLGCSMSVVYRMVTDGTLAAMSVGERGQLRFRRHDVDALSDALAAKGV